MSVVPDPPAPFDADEEALSPGDLFYRVYSNSRTATEFNPGVGPGSRFAFFTDEQGAKVPVLYAAASQDSAVAESLLHDVPRTGGVLPYSQYAGKVMGRLRVTGGRRLAKLRGLGLHRLRIRADQLTDTDASEYDRTAAWTRAAHVAGFDGLSWTSRLCNDAQAIVLFEDRCANAIEQDPSFGRLFQSGPGLDWLISTCAPLHVDVLPPSR